MSLPVTVVCGIDRIRTRATAQRLVVGHPERVLLEYDLTQVGVGLVGRTATWGDGRLHAGVTELAHGCVSCTLRETVLPTLVHLARARGTSHAVLALPEVVEPAAFVEAFHHLGLTGGSPGPHGTAADGCHVTGIVTCVDGSYLVPVVADGLTLGEAGRHAADADHRTLGDVLVRQVETADTIVALEATPGEHALLELLNPHAAVRCEHTVDPAELVRPCFDLDTTLDRADPSLTLAGGDLEQRHDAWRLAWRSRRPLHPQRLADAIENLTSQALRSRGRVWLAGHPAEIVGWDAVGPRVTLDVVGAWIEGADACAWDHAHPHHRIRAQLDWNPRVGDRFCELVLTGLGDLPTGAVAALRRVVLTDAEMTATGCGRRLDLTTDPFADVFDGPLPGTSPDVAGQRLKRA